MHGDHGEEEKQQPVVRLAHAREQEPAADGRDDDDRHDRDLVRDVRRAEADAREQRGWDGGERRPRPNSGQQEREARDDDERRELEAVVRVDLRVEALQVRDGVILRRRRERAALVAERRRRDVDDGDETGNPRRPRHEHAVEPAAENRHPVALVVRDGAFALRRERDDDRARVARRPRREVRGQERRPLRHAAEVCVLLAAADELCERLAAVRRRPGTGDEQPDGAVTREQAQLPARHVVDDDDAEGRGGRHRPRRRRAGGHERREHDQAEKEYAAPTEHRPPRFSPIRTGRCVGRR